MSEVDDLSNNLKSNPPINKLTNDRSVSKIYNLYLVLVVFFLQIRAAPLPI